MIVVCVENCGNRLPARYFVSRLASPKTKYNLTLGKPYTVYATEDLHGMPFFYICDDDYTWYPMRLPACLFEILDGTPSRHWIVAERDGSRLKAPTEWIQYRSFYDDLVEMDEYAMAIFAAVKGEIDEEISNMSADGA